ncbi:hypothetical protein SGPA1_50778 [Streptomyces misionensis JCM 4497]
MTGRPRPPRARVRAGRATAVVPVCHGRAPDGGRPRADATRGAGTPPRGERHWIGWPACPCLHGRAR